MSESSSIQSLVIVLCNKRSSSFILDGTRGTGNEISLDCPSEVLLPVESTSFEKRGNDKEAKRHKIRYIRGCETIYVDEQKEQGYEPNPQADTIVIEMGMMHVERIGADTALYDYIKKCEFNEANREHFPNVVPIFKEIDTKVQAEEATFDLDEQAEALSIVRQLRNKVKDGYSYKEDDIDNYCRVLNLQTAGLSYAEKLKSLADLANSNPKLFMANVLDEKSKILMTLRQGIELQIVHLHEDGLKRNSDNSIIYKPKGGKNTEKSENEIVNYFKSPAGTEAYQLLYSQVQSAMVESI